MRKIIDDQKNYQLVSSYTQETTKNIYDKDINTSKNYLCEYIISTSPKRLIFNHDD